MGGFAEVVHLGVKKLALSEVMTPEKMDDVMADAQIIAERNEVLIWRETDFLVNRSLSCRCRARKNTFY